MGDEGATGGGERRGLFHKITNLVLFSFYSVKR